MQAVLEMQIFETFEDKSDSACISGLHMCSSVPEIRLQIFASPESGEIFRGVNGSPCHSKDWPGKTANEERCKYLKIRLERFVYLMQKEDQTSKVEMQIFGDERLVKYLKSDLPIFASPDVKSDLLFASKRQIK